MPKGDRGEAIGYFGFATFKPRHCLIFVPLVFRSRIDYFKGRFFREVGWGARCGRPFCRGGSRAIFLCRKACG
jgi:hypothetical protein